jgi:acyl carrier protein
MIPSVFKAMPGIPYSANGKVDYRALPDVTNDSHTMVFPSSATEDKLAAIWKLQFDLKEISIEDDFFALGGHSIVATRLMSRVEGCFGLDLPLSLLFEVPTNIRGLASRIDSFTAGRAKERLKPAVASSMQRTADANSNILEGEPL